MLFILTQRGGEEENLKEKCSCALHIEPSHILCYAYSEGTLQIYELASSHGC